MYRDFVNTKTQAAEIIAVSFIYWARASGKRLNGASLSEFVHMGAPAGGPLDAAMMMEPAPATVKSAIRARLAQH